MAVNTNSWQKGVGTSNIMRISKKLVLNTTLLGLLSVLISSLILGIISYSIAKRALETQSEQQLIAVRDLKKRHIEDYFSNLRTQILGFAHHEVFVNAAYDLRNAFLTYPQEANQYGVAFDQHGVDTYVQMMTERYAQESGHELDPKVLATALFDPQNPYASLQYHYVIDAEHKRNSAPLIQYHQMHAKYDAMLRGFRDTIRINDLWLVDPNTGNVFYTVQKNPDFGVSIRTLAKRSPDLNTGFEKIFAMTGFTPIIDQALILDFEPYLPALDKQRGFLMAPIFSHGEKIAILVFELDINAINEVMTNHQQWKEEGLQDTGETYLVGPDFRLRSMSRFFYQSPEAYLMQMKKIGISELIIQEMRSRKTSIGIQPVLTIGAKEAQNEVAGFRIFRDYRNIPVLSAYAPLTIPGLDWVILSEIDESEAFAPVKQLAKQLTWFGLISAITLGVLAMVFSRHMSLSISGPIERFSQLISDIAKKLDLTQRIEVKGDDELSDMGKALNTLFEQVQSAFKDTLESTREMQSTASLIRKIAAEAQLARASMPPTPPAPPRSLAPQTPPSMPSMKTTITAEGKMTSTTPSAPGPITREDVMRKLKEIEALRKTKEAMVRTPETGAPSLGGQTQSQEALAKAGNRLDALSQKLTKLSHQFKIMEREAARKRGW